MSVLEDFDDALVQGDLQRDSGDFDGAVNQYCAVLAKAPDLAKGHFKLATVYARQGRTEQAEQSYREAIALDPCYAEAHGNLGVLLFTRGDWDEAERCYRHALANNPDNFEAHVNLSRLLYIASRHLEALYFARRAIALNPFSAIAVERAGLALGKLGRIGESIAELRRATEIDPAVASPWISLAGALQAIGHYKDSDAAYVKAMAASDDDPVPRANRAFWANYRSLPRETVWQRHREFGAWVREILGPVAAQAPTGWRPDPKRRLRVGVVSADLRRHSVGYFVRGALEHLDRHDFQFYAYFDHHGEDQVSFMLKPMFHEWCDIFSQTDDVVLERIRQDRIDILIDLAGHTGANRMRLFARRAAPVQVTYLGYPNTTGLDTMDYRLTDRWADPEGDGDEFHSETLWRLPNSFLCYTAPTEDLPLAEPPLMKNGFPTFGSFNNRIKISDQCLALWVRLLREIPESRLVLKSIQGTEDKNSRQSLLDQFIEQGIDSGRVQVHAQVSGLENHLDMYSRIDLALDTFPYNGTTTTCEALWMGVPVIGMTGDRHVSRVGESLLNNLGLPELVARDEEDYLRIVKELASDSQRLATLRREMRQRMRTSHLMDSRLLGHDLGDAFRAMWRRHCNAFDADLPLEETVADTAADLLKLHIGGSRAEEGWKRLDTTPGNGVDFVGDVRDLSAFADESCAALHAENVLQHLRPHDILPALNGLYRILMPGGRLYLAVPDFEVLSGLIADPELDKSEKFKIMRTIFGFQDADDDLNRIGLNFDFLVDYLADIGFASVEHVESFGLLEDATEPILAGRPFSLNLIVTK